MMFSWINYGNNNINMDVSTPQGAGAAPGLVYTTKGCAAPGGVYSTLQGPELSLEYFEILLSMR